MRHPLSAKSKKRVRTQKEKLRFFAEGPQQLFNPGLFSIQGPSNPEIWPVGSVLSYPVKIREVFWGEPSLGGSLQSCSCVWSWCISLSLVLSCSIVPHPQKPPDVVICLLTLSGDFCFAQPFPRTLLCQLQAVGAWGMYLWLLAQNRNGEIGEAGRQCHG